MNFFEILPWLGNNMHTPPPLLAHLTQRVMLAFVITASIIRPSTITKKSSPLKPLGQLRPNFGGMVLWQSTSKIVSDSPDLQPTWPLLLEIKKGDEILKIFIFETTGPIGTKVCLNSPWVIPFQNCPVLGSRWTLLPTINDSFHIK